MTPKCTQNHSQMSTKKYYTRFCNSKKRTPSLLLRKIIKNRLFLSFSVLLCYAMDAKVVQNRRKLTTKLSQKMRHPVLQWLETHAVERTAKMHQNAFIFLFPVLLCSRHGCKNRSKSSKTGFCMDPTNFRFKIHEISAIGAKCYLNVARSAPDMKITTFCKVLPERAQNANFHAFS